MTDRPPTLTLGFLTVFHDPNGYLGGYLTTNSWGRPLEFRLTTAVQPSRIQEVLYGRTLTEYIHADLIGKTLVEKTGTPPTIVITNVPTVLPLRSRIDVPVIALAADASAASDALSLTHARAKGVILFPARFPEDRATIEQLLEAIDPAVDLTEPFARIREAVAEARKMGVTGRAA